MNIVVLCKQVPDTYSERRLREEFGFAGSPVEVTMRVREKRGRADRHG